MAINDNYNPEYDVSNQRKASEGRRAYYDMLRTMSIDSDEYNLKTLSGILEGYKKYERKQKELDNVEKAYIEALKDNSESGKKRADNIYEYMMSISNSSDALLQQLENSKSSLEANRGISVDVAKDIAKAEKDLNASLEEIEAKSAQLKSKAELSEQDRADLRELDREKHATQNAMRRLKGEKEEEYMPASVKSVIDALGGSKTGAGAFLNAFGGNEKIEKGIDTLSTKLGGIDKLVKTTELIHGALGAIKQQMSKSITEAANTLKDYYGVINANLESSGKTFDTISSQADDLLSANRLVKQTDYLSQIATLSNQGLVDDIETRAILETIKNKTLTTFSSIDAGLLRLIRLQTQANTATQFGMEVQLKRVLNSVFKDSNYLSTLFDGVTEAITDAGVSTQSDITQFNSTVQTWLGAMYESGLSNNLVSQLAQGINNLGSGNVSALASDETTQRLFLLAMDRINMDYADVLQQGLSSSDINKLMQSVVEYLNEIATNTKDNLVLRSSYSNLFNMSVSDMQAIQNLSSRVGEISGTFINSSNAIKQTQNALANTVAANTTASEQFNNLFDNLSYTFGSAIAESNGLYTTYRVSEIIYNLLNPISEMGGAVGKAASAGKLIAGATQYVIGVKGLVDLISNGFDSFDNESLVGFLSSASSSTSSEGSASEQIKKIGLRKQWLGEGGLVSSISSDTSDWEDEGDSTLALLKEMSKTLMKLKEGGDNDYAFAVSVEGMNDNVLRSFASIFADEDAMMATFTGNNNVLKDALFDYFDDTTSNAKSTTAE